jgi:hypothetical protein
MKALRVSIVIAVAFLLPLLANMTVRFWAEPPEYMDYSRYYPPEPKTAAERAAAEKERRTEVASYEEALAEFNLQLFYACSLLE